MRPGEERLLGRSRKNSISFYHLRLNLPYDENDPGLVLWVALIHAIVRCCDMAKILVTRKRAGVGLIIEI